MNKLHLKMLLLPLFCILLYLNTNAQIHSVNKFTVQKQIGYGLETLGFCVIAYSNLSTHYESLNLKEPYRDFGNPDHTLYEGRLAIYVDEFAEIEKNNLKNTILGGTIVLGGIFLNLLPQNYNEKYIRKQNLAIISESLGAGILIYSVIKRQNTINSYTNLYAPPYGNVSLEQKLESESAILRTFSNLQRSRLGIFTGSAFLFYGVLTHYTSLRFIDNISLTSNGNNISMIYKF